MYYYFDDLALEEFLSFFRLSQAVTAYQEGLMSETAISTTLFEGIGAMLSIADEQTQLIILKAATLGGETLRDVFKDFSEQHTKHLQSKALGETDWDKVLSDIMN